MTAGNLMTMEEDGCYVSLENTTSFQNFLADKKRLALLLDFDGTLSPLVSRPEDAILPQATKLLLERLVSLPTVSLAIISGREVENVRSKVDIPGITYAGSHGLDIIFADASRYNHPVPDTVLATSRQLVETISRTCVRDGASIEDKGAVFTFHYRNVPKEKQQGMISEVETMIEAAGFKAGRAHAAIESKPPLYWGKGKACKYIMERMYGSDWHRREVGSVYVGDDVTDEDAMLALKGLGYSFKVTSEFGENHQTNADAKLPCVKSVASLLKLVETTMSERIDK